MKVHTLGFVGALGIGALILNVWFKPFSSSHFGIVPGDRLSAIPVEFTVADLLRHALEENKQSWPRPLFEGAVEAIAGVVEQYHYPPELVLGLIQTESRFHLDAVSPVGAMGLTQIMPATAAFVAHQQGQAAPGPRELFNPAVNIRLGFTFLAYLESQYGSRDAALTVYNGGPEVLLNWCGGDLPLASYRHSVRTFETAYARWLKSPSEVWKQGGLSP